MCDVLIPVLDEPSNTGYEFVASSDAANLLALHREILETIRLTLAGCAHPSCDVCQELIPVLDRYLMT